MSNVSGACTAMVGWKRSTAAARRGSARPRRLRPALPVGCSGSAMAVARHRIADRRPPLTLDLRRARARSRRSAPCRRRRPPRPARARARGPGAARATRPALRPSPTSGKRNSKCGANQRGIERDSPRRAARRARRSKSCPDEVRQHEAVVQRRAPAHQRAAVGPLPEPRHQRADQQLLRRGSCARAAASRRRAARPGRAGPSGRSGA